MNRDEVIRLAVEAVELAAKMALPLLLAALVVGLAVSLFQAVTQIQEMTLSFIPKLMVAALVAILAGPWMLDQLVVFTTELYASIPERSGK
jgi:flagellar biosynthesis protein FliQ